MVQTRRGTRYEYKDDGKIHCHHCRRRKNPKGGLTCYLCSKFYCQKDLKKNDPSTHASSSSGWRCYFCQENCGCSDCLRESQPKRNPKRKPPYRLLLEKIKSLEQQLADKENEETEARTELGRRDVNDSTGMELLCGDESRHPTDPGDSVSYPTPAESTGRGIEAETGRYFVDSTNVICKNIRVMIRVRSFTPREIASGDMNVWECDGRSIVRSNPRTQAGTRYTFDRVFDQPCENLTIYEEGVRDVVYSALKGINGTIIAYGQTNSGKTYTMSGITEILIVDMYSYMQKSGSNFVIKFYALEVYNEDVFDLTRTVPSLRLFDDHKKKLVIEGLNEIMVRDGQHLRGLIDACAAKRKNAGTNLNDRSSRSHQIIKLAIESSHCDASGRVRSLFAILSLVDLAGSEGAAENDACGSRFEEAGYINKSLVSLSNVIRSLSRGRKFDHIRYRDSKLTRLLESSLGGNSHTAVICTLSPASRHVSQSVNTLSFANQARNVTNSARVNVVVVSEKQLADYWRKEFLSQKQRNKQLETELLAIKRERDFALSELEKVRRHKKQKV